MTTTNVTTLNLNKTLPALPEHLRGLPPKSGSNDEVRDGLSSGFVAPPRISIEGKVFRVVQDGVSRPLVRVVDGNEEPVQSLNVVVLRANRGKYKAYYDTKYDPDADPVNPKCYSYDGITPSLMADEPQSDTCATCEHNKWGSSITEAGKKSRACSDNKILAVIPLAAVSKQADPNSVEGQVYSVKVTPTALSRNREDRNADPANNTSLAEYVGLLDAYPTQDGSAEVPISNVVTKLFFEVNSQYPLLRFKLSRFLTVEEIAYIQTRVDGDDIKRIISDQGGSITHITEALSAPEKRKVLTGPPKDEADDLDFAAPPAAPAAPPARRGRPPKAEVAAAPSKRERVKTEPVPAQVDDAIAKLGTLFD